MRHGIINITDDSGTWRWAQRHYQVCRREKTSQEITGNIYTVIGINNNHINGIIGAALVYTPLYTVTGVDIDIQIQSGGTSVSSIEPYGSGDAPANSRVLLYTGTDADTAGEIWLGDALTGNTPYIANWDNEHTLNIYKGTTDAPEVIGTCTFSPQEISTTRQHFTITGLSVEQVHAIQFDIILRVTATVALEEIPYIATLSID